MLYEIRVLARRSVLRDETRYLYWIPACAEMTKHLNYHLKKMTTETEKKIPAGRWLLLYGILFGLSYPQEALFSSNQNTKFITGLARAGYGDIAADWMARITDPFPLFSHLLQWQYQLLGLYAGTHLSFFLIAGAYGILGVWLAKSFFADI